MLSAETLARLEELKTSVEEFFDQAIADIDSQVEFLRRVDTSVSKLASPTTEQAADRAMEIIDGLLP